LNPHLLELLIKFHVDHPQSLVIFAAGSSEQGRLPSMNLSAFENGNKKMQLCLKHYKDQNRRSQVSLNGSLATSSKHTQPKVFSLLGFFSDIDMSRITGCYICGDQMPVRDRQTHERACMQKWRRANSARPEGERLTEPQRPDFRFTGNYLNEPIYQHFQCTGGKDLAIVCEVPEVLIDERKLNAGH